MAKLNGVTTVIPAQAERIMYDGVEYVKSDEAPAAGDIVRLDDAYGIGYLTEGGFYVVDDVDGVGDAQITDDDGDDFDTCGVDFTLFKRVKPAAQPDIKTVDATDIVEHNGVKYRKVLRNAARGDRYIMALTDRWDITEVTKGRVYAIERIDSDGDPRFLDNAGDGRYLPKGLYAVLEPLETEAPTSAPTKLPVLYAVHDGRVYVREERKARVGELVLITKRRLHFIRVGEIVPCVGYATFSAKATQFVDGRGVDNTQGIGPDEYSVLVPATSIPLDGVEYAIEQRKATVGERVLVVKPHLAFTYGLGDIREVKITAANGVTTTQVDDILHQEYVVLTPKAAVKTAPQTTPKYREVERPANVGERIRIVAAHEAHGKYKDGDEFVAEERSTVGGVYVSAVSAVGNRNGLIADDEYVVLEPEEAALTVGDHAKVTRDIYEYKTGDIVKLMSLVSRPGSMFDFSIKNLRTGGNGYVASSFIVRATDEEIAAAKRRQTDKQSQPERLKVGEYARVIDDNHSTAYKSHGVPVGTIVRVTGVATSMQPYEAVPVDGGVRRWCTATDLERISAVDVEKAQAAAALKQALETFKPGVKVRLTIAEGERPKHGWGAAKNGEVGTVRNVRESDGKVTVDFPSQSLWNAAFTELTVLTDEEAAGFEREKRAAAETANWAAIGRKVGEYKVGDIVDCVGAAKGKTGIGVVIKEVVPLREIPRRVSDLVRSMLGTGRYYHACNASRAAFRP
ncbi:hypothetical protein [Paenibacillus elgii]|uniref:hypothetical protein n=1 Tax=Paenibacillus elgii TaxID=189691 RepID=UPI000248DEEB|nr:hypothetical protein [Paenibacillus elgii]